MEQEGWKLDFDWLRVRHYIKDAMGKDALPDLQSILFLIGIQELGRWDVGKNFSKEEKQDLMHVAVCTLLETEGYFKFVGRDGDGWPHWKELQPFDVSGIKGQSEFLKRKIVEYFNAMDVLSSVNIEEE